MMKRIYLRVHDIMVGHPWAVVVAAGLAAVLASSGMPRQKMDMSFKPFFVDRAELTAPTEQFVEVFGPIDQTHIGAIVENDRILSAGFLRHVAALSERIRALPDVVEVVSLTHLWVPGWTERGLAVGRILPPRALEDEAVLGAMLEKLRHHPAIKGTLLSADGRKTLILVRMNPALRSLEARRPLLDSFRQLIAEAGLAGTTYRVVGASVVEQEYAGIVARNVSLSVGLNAVVLIVVLLVLFRRAACVAIALCGVGVATPMTLGVMHYIGQPITIINSMVSTMVMIIGVADAIHMLRCFDRHRAAGQDVPAAVREMFAEMATPCLMTTVTTALGFLSLRMAEMAAIRDFGLNVAIGVVLVYLANLVCIPLLLRALPARWTSRRGEVEGGLLERGLGALTGRVIARPVLFVLGSLLVAGAGLAFLPALEVNQRFNEDVSAEHPVRKNQEMLEREFRGYLGPVVSIRRTDGGSMLRPDTMSRLRAYQDAVAAEPEVLLVRSFLDYLPANMPVKWAGEGLAGLRSHPEVGAQVRELINPSADWIGVQVRTTDMGTRRAEGFGRRMASLARAHLGRGLRTELVGEWWLSQGGMRGLLRDMLVSFATSCVLVLAVLALAVRQGRLFLVGVLPNLLPMGLALGFMAMTGITVRIGTAMVLAIALGIAIDDTIHFLVGMREQTRAGAPPRQAVRLTMAKAGSGIIYTSIVLVLGFGSMLLNELLAIRDMGLVAAVTLVVALAADVLLAPALYLAVLARTSARQAEPASL